LKIKQLEAQLIWLRRFAPNDAACVIQRAWRLFHFSCKLQTELGEVARQMVRKVGANVTSSSMIASIRLLSRSSLLAKLNGDKLPSHAGSHLLGVDSAWMTNIIVEELVTKVLDGTNL